MFCHRLIVDHSRHQLSGPVSHTLYSRNLSSSESTSICWLVKVLRTIVPISFIDIVYNDIDRYQIYVKIEEF